MSDSCDPMDCGPPGSSVHGISQARILEWVAISSPGDLPDPGIKLISPALQADSLSLNTREAPYQSLTHLLRPISFILSSLWSLSTLPYAHLNTFFLNTLKMYFQDSLPPSFLFFWLHCMACRVPVPWLVNTCLLQWNHRVLTTRLPGKSLMTLGFRAAPHLYNPNV